jgi:hypothetical protein
MYDIIGAWIGPPARPAVYQLTALVGYRSDPIYRR